MNPFIAMFFVTLFNKEKYRYNYGLKLSQSRMENVHIALPVDDSGAPNFRFMEDFIRSLMHSSNLLNIPNQVPKMG